MSNCPICGAPQGVPCGHPREAASMETAAAPSLTRERLEKMNTLEIEVQADLGPALEAVRAETGADLQARPDGYHLTIIGPTESKILSTLDEETLAELQKINEEIQRGEGIVIKGIGYIDGANSPYQMREVDKVKKTSFVAIEIPALQQFRAKVGLPPKYFHVTLGFVGGDIHFQVTGQEPVKPGSPKMKDLTAPIPKQADARFASIQLPEMKFGGLDGQMKESK